MAIKKSKQKTKHIFIRPDLHSLIKEQAAKEGKKIQFFTNELIEWAIGYKKFLDKN
jgi:hypothetical protein